MGSEQSSHAPPGGTDRILSPGATAPRDPLLALSRDGAGIGSPEVERQSSVCSEAETETDVEKEVPYVSYTVNQPIGGDSPKKKTKAPGQSGPSRYYRFASPKFRSSRLQQKSSLVVVRDDRDKTKESTESDPDLQRLRELPSFLPIVRASLSGHGAALKDPDILERLDFRGLLALAQRYEDQLRKYASDVTTEQQDLNRQVREVDALIAGITEVLADRQRKQAKVIEQLQKVKEMSKTLNKCHLLLNENIEQIEILNNMLPQEDRLEPFVWTTG